MANLIILTHLQGISFRYKPNYYSPNKTQLSGIFQERNSIQHSNFSRSD